MSHSVCAPIFKSLLKQWVNYKDLNIKYFLYIYINNSLFYTFVLWTFFFFFLQTVQQFSTKHLWGNVLKLSYLKQLVLKIGLNSYYKHQRAPWQVYISHKNESQPNYKQDKGRIPHLHEQITTDHKNFSVIRLYNMNTPQLYTRYGPAYPWPSYPYVLVDLFADLFTSFLL